ncbi:cyclin-dependent kinase 7-like [Dermatophagoides farinae]|nr:cyclin-dependent kinase 7-like [Dermatophagoides farinae]
MNNKKRKASGASKKKRYEKIEFLGEGQFAYVYKARDVQTDQIVAVKKIKLGSRFEARDGINRTALREIKILQELSHENIIGLLDVFGHVSDVSLVFEYMLTDLEVIIKDINIFLTPANVKSYIIMTLKGLEYLHTKWILHRDLKPNNLLIDGNGVLKIGDFGLAKSFGSPTRILTNQVVTRWYRAPELLYGARMYGTGVDIWSIGCIIAELVIRLPFFQGQSDLDQMLKIFQVMGTPNETNWPGVTNLPDYVKFNVLEPVPFENIFTAIKEDLIQVLQSMLALDPNRRCTCSQALQMAYFHNDPPPTPTHLLPKVKNEISSEDITITDQASGEPTMSGTKRANLFSLDNVVAPPHVKRLNFDDD